MENSNIILLKKKVFRSPNYAKLIKTLGKHPNLRHKEIKEKSGINKNSLSPLLDKGVKVDKLIEKREMGRITIYNLSKLGSKIYKQSEKYEEIKKDIPC